jgi:hypothetical protein
MMGKRGGLVKFRENIFIVVLVIAFVFLFFSCQQEESVKEDEVKPAMSESEVDSDVPALHDLHEIVYPLWHDAYPDKDYALIKELLPEADSLTQKLDEAELPGILRDIKPDWDLGKDNLKSSLQALHLAVEENNQEDMLAQVEVFHSAFEKLIRLIRPVVPELEAFHQEMYKLYHYYMPNYELPNIRLAVTAMQQKLLPLKEVQLPHRLAEMQGQFDAAVQDLGTHLFNLSEVVRQDDKDLIKDAVEKVHTAYQKTKAVFD